MTTARRRSHLKDDVTAIVLAARAQALEAHATVWKLLYEHPEFESRHNALGWIEADVNEIFDIVNQLRELQTDE